MLKRNKIVDWLEQKSKAEQVQLLSRVRKLGPRMRQTDRKQELIVLRELGRKEGRMFYLTTHSTHLAEREIPQ